MPFVVTEPCRGCKYTDCVVVCPCECFHEDDQMLLIDPDACIDCEACATECPVTAIYRDTEVPAPWRHYIELNAQGVRRLPQIIEKKEALKRNPEADFG